jgi:uncharacterized protein with HEPN domain
MQGNQKDILRLKHILDSISEIEKYTSIINFEQFSNNSMMVDASIRHLEIIGEASNHLSDSIKTTYTTIEWRQIIGFRNLLIHEYFSIDIAIVWQVIQFDLPHLKQIIIEIIKDFSSIN